MNRVFNAIHSFKECCETGIATTEQNCGCEFRPRKFRPVSAEPLAATRGTPVKNTVLGDCSTVGRYCVIITWHKSSNVHCKL